MRQQRPASRHRFILIRLGAAGNGMITSLFAFFPVIRGDIGKIYPLEFSGQFCDNPRFEWIPAASAEPCPVGTGCSADWRVHWLPGETYSPAVDRTSNERSQRFKQVGRHGARNDRNQNPIGSLNATAARVCFADTRSVRRSGFIPLRKEPDFSEVISKSRPGHFEDPSEFSGAE